ncbi:MAG: FG-GAP-like repeat-containing protein [Bacteroidales bacterium]|nr:FG-GAP-like repeat-containing protein [Bacteroidales bacterium]
MKKLTFISILIFNIFFLTSFSQNNKATFICQYWELRGDHTGRNDTYIARDYIKLKQDFKYTADVDNKFIGKINPNLIFNTNYTSTQTPHSTNLPVGSLPGSVNVSPTGAATYQIPIVLPPGTAGMMPGLSIVYNSQSGDGMLGRGWTIGGFSAISRIPSTLYHDDMVDGVDFDENDRFALDGQRLIETISYPDEKVYHTEIENFSEVRSYDKTGYGPSEFQVKTKTGLTLQYGYTKDSRIQTQYEHLVMYYLLNKVTDALGNYYTITYKEENGEFYPLQIEYTENDNGLSSYNTVKFFYTSKTDKSSAYVEGFKFKNTVLLSDIKIYNNNYLIRKYTFKYNFNSFSRLSEIQLYEDKNKTINTTKIEWGNETDNYDLDQINITGADDYYPGDYNGDGKTDLFVAVKLLEDGYLQYDEVGNVIYEKWQYYTVDNNGNFILKEEHDLDCHIKCYPLDFNGDGKSDILYAWYDSDDDLFFYYLLRSRGESFQYLFAHIEDHNPYEKREIKIADFNGDGKSDILIVTEKSNKSNYEILTWNWQYVTYPLLVASTSEGNIIKKVVVNDFNGNGKSDVMFIYNRWDGYACRIKEIEKLEDGSYHENELYIGGYPTKAHSIFTGDFNGDGKSDLLTWCESASWEIHLSKGNAYAWSGNPEINFDHNNDPEQFYNDDNYIVADYNGDGKADVLEQYDISGNQSRFNIFYSQGNSFIKEANNIEDIYPYIQEFRVNADFNGDGKQDCLLNTGHYTNYRKVIYFHPHEQKNLVKSITNGYNNIIQFEYKPITSSDVYTKGSGANFPVIDFQGALFVTKNLYTNDGVGGFLSQNYKYESAKIHRQGKGFLGFMKVTSENTRNKIFSETEFIYNTTYYNTYPVSTRTYYYNTDSLISSSAVTNQYIQHLGDKRIYTYPKETESTDHLTNTTINSSFNYDSNGNLTRSYINYDDEGNTEALYQDYITAGAWLPTKPEKTIIKKTATGKPLYTRTSEFEYYSNGFLKKSIEDPNDDKSITGEYWYNNFGNTTHTKVSAPDEEDKDSYFEYDSKNRFVINQTDPLGFTSEQTYDEETGNILTETDINGHITKFKYNAFGSLIETELPDGTKAYQTINWYPGGIITYAHTYSTVSADGVSPVTTYYDKLGRKIRTETSGFNNEKTISIIRYSNKGHVYKTYEPHFEGEDGNYTWFYYDNYGRQSSIISPIGTTSYDFTGKTTTVTGFDGEQTSKTINSLGQVVIAKDNGGEINYDYNSAGLPLTITAPGGAVVSIAYDNYGNKTSLTDPDAGIINYEYDAFSNITKQTDANQNMHEMEYDIAGRLTEKSGPEGVTTYVYDVALNGLGMLASEQVTPVGNRQVYTYDNLSRLSSVTETFENEDYTYSYNYDNLSRINRMTYPSGFAYTKHYKADNGYLEQINRADNGDLIWKAEDMNALGQLTQYCKGVNEITTYKTYDDYHRPEAVVTGDFQHFEYYFEKETGNLLSREDVIHSNKESFEYDDNRLHKIWQGYTPALVNTINYDTTGNISSKTDAGTYNYDANKIHAVTQVEGDLYLPSNNQGITYTAFNKVKQISENNDIKAIPGIKLYFTYGLNNQRKKTVLEENGHITQTKYFFGSYEKTINNLTGEITEYNYLPGGAIFKKVDGVGEMLFTYTDHLGSITHITDDQGNFFDEHEQSFDAWGRIRNPETWELLNSPFSKGVGGIINDRGYTGHEMLPQFALINMNGRLYDPILGRMLSPDNYIQMPDFTQNFNRYSYVLNNPLKYVDPDGEIIWMPVIIGAVAGGYSGYQIGKAMGATGLGMAGYIAGGAVIGAVSGGIAAEFAAAGGFMANTASIVAGSYMNSTGMAVLSSGMTDVNVGFGAGSYNITQNEWSGIWAYKDNTFMENAGYVVGASANVQDIFAGFNGTTVDVKAKWKIAGHSEVEGKYLYEYDDLDNPVYKKILISVGPEDRTIGSTAKGGLKWEMEYVKRTLQGHSVEGQNSLRYWSKYSNVKLNNVNGKILSNMTERLFEVQNLFDTNRLKYGLLYGCVNYTSRALLFSGVVNINAFLPVTTPLLLNAEMFARQMTIYNMAYFINDYN